MMNFGNSREKPRVILSFLTRAKTRVCLVRYLSLHSHHHTLLSHVTFHQTYMKKIQNLAKPKSLLTSQLCLVNEIQMFAQTN